MEEEDWEPAEEMTERGRSGVYKQLDEGGKKKQLYVLDVVGRGDGAAGCSVCQRRHHAHPFSFNLLPLFFPASTSFLLLQLPFPLVCLFFLSTTL